MKTYLAIDIGGTFVKTAIVDEKANILTSYKRKNTFFIRGIIRSHEKSESILP